MILSSCFNKIQKAKFQNIISISTSNLSEDASILSTKDDELLFLVYQKQFNDSFILKSKNYFEFDSINSNIEIKIEEKLSNAEIIIVLLEIDSDKTLEQIEYDVNKNLKILLNAFEDFDLIKLIETLGDDDLLGIKSIKMKSNNKPTSIVFQGINLFDYYVYEIVFE